MASCGFSQRVKLSLLSDWPANPNLLMHFYPVLFSGSLDISNRHTYDGQKRHAYFNNQLPSVSIPLHHARDCSLGGYLQCTDRSKEKSISAIAVIMKAKASTIEGTFYFSESVGSRLILALWFLLFDVLTLWKDSPGSPFNDGNASLSSEKTDLSAYKDNQHTEVRETSLYVGLKFSLS